MKKLKTILQCNYFFYIFLIFSLLFTFVYINNDYKSYYNEEYKEVIGIVKDYKIKDNKTIIYIKSKENLVINYYKKIDNISYGDYIKVKGEFYKPKNNTNFNLFNYKKYLLSKKIKYAVTGNDIAIIRKNKNILYALKNKLLDRVNKCNKTSNYIKTFLFADKNYIQEEIYKSYQTLGVSHLFAISGMHVSLVTMLLLKILYKLKEKNKYLIISIFLLFYLFLTNFTVSMLRAVFQFILFFINKLFKLNIKNTNLVILLFSLFLIINPYNIYNIGFMFSFSISFSLIRFNNLLSNGNFLYKLFKVSIISFLTSIPILINNFNNINLLSVVFNIIYVPYISYIVFPFSLITIIFPFLDNLTFVFINIFENISIFLSNINILTISISKLPTYLIIIYYIFLYILFNNIKLKNIIFMIIIFIIFVLYRKYLFNSEIVFMNVNQGDCTLIREKNKNILIDTGGLVSFNKDNNYNLTDNVLIPYFKSSGVSRIDYLIITHGDFDHMGESINLVNNFKVEKVIFNCGPYNDLEKELIKVLDKKKIEYYSCIKELNIDNNKLYFLQTKEYDNENDNSNVTYTELDGYKLMFMGDAGVEKEKDISEKYNISNIDVLKVGHHGSKTSSSKEFIDEINPNYSIISVGKNNRYGHPNKEVLNNLENTKIYRTDEDGSIMFKIKNSKLKIETCSP